MKKFKEFLNRKIDIKTLLVLVLIVLTTTNILLTIQALSNNNIVDQRKAESHALTETFATKSGNHYRQFTNEYKEAEKIFPFVAFNLDEKQPFGHGTAFYYKNETVLTNYHNAICDKVDFKCGYFVFKNGGWIQVKEIRRNNRIDLAAFRAIEQSFNLDNIKICDTDVKIGQEIWSFGFGLPYIQSGSLKIGYQNTNTSAFPLKEISGNFTNSMAHINIKSGDSGSPLFKKGDNCVFGVVNASNNAIDNITSYASYYNLINFLNEVEVYFELNNKGENNE